MTSTRGSVAAMSVSPASTPTPAPATTARDHALAGVRDVLPVVLGVIPFGLVAGIAAVEVGIGGGGALAFSTLIFAGASQLAALDLIGRDAPVLVVILTIVVINSRMLMYSAALAPRLAGTSLPARAGAAGLLTDQAFGLSILAYDQPERGLTQPRDRLAYYLGCAIPLYVNWQIFTMVGVLVGAAVPSWLPLGFAVPLVFLALLPPAISSRPGVLAAVVGGGVAVLGQSLPANLGMPAGAIAGIIVGTVAELRGGPPADLPVDAAIVEVTP